MSHGGRPGPETAQSSHQAPNPLGGSERSSTFGSTDPTGNSSNSHGTQFTLPSDLSNANPPQEDGRLRILGELEGIVDSLRGGKASKTETIASVIRALEENTDVTLTPSQKDATFDSYLTEILAIQSSLDESRVPPNEETSLRPSLSPGNRRDHDEIDSGAESDSGSPSKRLKLVESDMPWFVPDGDTSRDSSNASCMETCRLLRAFNRDVAKAKFLIKIDQTPQVESPLRSGNVSSKEKQSTSINSSRRSTMLSLMRRERVAWETRKSLLGSLNQRRGFQQRQNGPPLGGGLPKPSRLPSPTARRATRVRRLHRV